MSGSSDMLWSEFQILFNSINDTSPTYGRSEGDKRERERERERERDGARRREEPAWTQKWSMPLLKSGMYMDLLVFDPIILKKYFTANDTITLNCSENGKTSGPTAVKFFSIACPATLTISLLNRTPVFCVSSSV
jgi:hypothetical protein